LLANALPFIKVVCVIIGLKTGLLGALWRKKYYTSLSLALDFQIIYGVW